MDYFAYRDHFLHDTKLVNLDPLSDGPEGNIKREDGQGSRSDPF